MILRISDDDDAPAVRLHDLRFRHGLFGVVRSLAVEVGLQSLKHPRRAALAEDRDVRDSANRRNDLRPLPLRHDRTPRAFDRPYRLVAVHGDDENVRHTRRILEIANMSDVENVEDAVGERDLLAALALRGEGVDELVFGEDGGVHSVPRFLGSSVARYRGTEGPRNRGT